MSIINIKHEVSDPAFYNSLILDQKKKARRNSNNANEWLELGRLYEAKIDIIKYFARGNFGIRYFILLYILSIFVFLFTLNFSILSSPSFSWRFIALISVLIIGSVGFLWLWLLRHPPSGIRYFKKAIDLDPQCGDAYMYLGLIALRRYQKKRALRYFELAVQLSTSNKNKIEQELKSIYEKEFSSFFNKKSEKNIRQQQIIDHQQDQIKTLRMQKDGLEKRVESLSGKLDQARWEMGHKTKMMEKEKKSHVSAIRQDYEGQIAVLKQEAKEEANELAARDFVRLTTEIMESKADLEAKSLATASRNVEDVLGNRLWETLSEQTRSYLATAEHIYAVLADQEEKPDYSLVGMELCKALETELNLRLVKPFITSLNGNKSSFLKLNQTGERKERPSYFTYLAMMADEANYPEVKGLTLGQYHFVLKLTLDGDYTLKEYEGFLDEICDSSGTTIGKTFLRNIEIVTKKYRNAIAHQSPMNKNQYDHLRKLIFTGKKALLRTCCEIVVVGQKIA